MKDKKFIIGIGSQRAGSTLLYTMLDKYSDAFMHPVKELHYFDTLYNIRAKGVLTDFAHNNLLRINQAIYQGKIVGNFTKRFRCELRTYSYMAHKSIKDIEYKDLFRPCLTESDYIGEITPEYMLLNVEQIKYMAQIIGKDAIIILITRNPVDRFASSVKLLNMYGKSYQAKVDINDAIRQAINTMPTWIEQQVRLNDYSTTITNYRCCFKNVISLSYEKLVEDPASELHKLKKYIPSLDVNAAISTLNNRVNSLGETDELTVENKKLIIDMHKKYNVSHEVNVYE